MRRLCIRTLSKSFPRNAYAFSSHPGSQIHDKQSYNKQIHDKEIHNKQIYDKEIHEKQSYNDHNTINSHDMNRRFLILCAILGTSAAVYTFQFCDTDLKTVLSIYQMKMSLAKVKEVPKTTRNDPRSLKIIENTDFVDEFNQKALNGPGNVVLVTGTNGSGKTTKLLQIANQHRYWCYLSLKEKYDSLYWVQLANSLGATNIRNEEEAYVAVTKLLKEWDKEPILICIDDVQTILEHRYSNIHAQQFFNILQFLSKKSNMNVLLCLSEEVPSRPSSHQLSWFSKFANRITTTGFLDEVNLEKIKQHLQQHILRLYLSTMDYALIRNDQNILHEFLSVGDDESLLLKVSETTDLIVEAFGNNMTDLTSVIQESTIVRDVESSLYETDPTSQLFLMHHLSEQKQHVFLDTELLKYNMRCKLRRADDIIKMSIETLARESNVSEETAEQYIRNLLRAIPKDGIEKANLEKHLSSSPFNFLSGLCCIFSRIKFNDAIRVLASVEVVAIDTFDKEKISFYRPVIGYAVENPYWYTYEKLKRME